MVFTLYRSPPSGAIRDPYEKNGDALGRKPNVVLLKNWMFSKCYYLTVTVIPIYPYEVCEHISYLRLDSRLI